MKKIKDETRKEMLRRLQAVARMMTQQQIDACAWMMGCANTGWTPGVLSAEYQPFIDGCTED